MLLDLLLFGASIPDARITRDQEELYMKKGHYHAIPWMLEEDHFTTCRRRVPPISEPALRSAIGVVKILPAVVLDLCGRMFIYGSENALGLSG